MKYRFLLLKRAIEDVFIFPFVLMGRLLSGVWPLRRDYRVFYFFPFYHTGGAEKVHSLIAAATGGKDCVIFFTRRSQNKAFLQAFQDSGCAIRDISAFTDNKWIYFVNLIFRGLVTGYINRQQQPPLVFNGQCNFGYKIAPWVRRGVRQIELIHSVSNFSYIRLPFLPFISQTVMISRQKIQEHIVIYRRFGVPPTFDKRIHYIPNASSFQHIHVNEKDFSRFRVLYSGRMSPEKRVHLIAQMAQELHSLDPSVIFEFAGDSFEGVRENASPAVAFAGNISDPDQLAEVYKRSHVLCLTSSTEGFPLAVIEAMAYGCVVLATPVGDLPLHIQPGRNGFLFSTATDEPTIVKEGVERLLQLKANPERLKEMAAANITYAQSHFSLNRFTADYQNLFSA